MSVQSLIQTIHNDKMNSICFDCGAKSISFVSINNGIFLCNECATVHMSFPQEISIIENSDLYSLTEIGLKYLAYGGNTRLNDFILEEFPKLENYSQKLLYKTRAMDYYRKRLNYFVNGGVEPRRPSQIVGCQLVPQSSYNKNYVKIPSKKYEPKNRTYKPEESETRKFNINRRNNDDYNDEEEFFRAPFKNEQNFGFDNNMFKKFFGDNFFGEDDDEFFGFGNKLNQSQRFDNYTSQQQRPEVYNNNTININKNVNINKEPKDNFSRKINTNDIYSKNINNRPQTAKNPIFVPSRTHKYIKKDQKEEQKYNPFQRRDSTDLIVIPGSKENEKKSQKTKEIPLEFHTRASGLGQLADTINENDDEYMSDKEQKDELDSSEELEQISKEKEQEKQNNKNIFYDGSQATFENSIRNKYKRKKTEELEKKLKDEEKLRTTPKYNNINRNNNFDNKDNIGNNRRKTKNTNSKDNGQFNMKSYARRLSKMNISTTNWNINQLGDSFTYPDAMEVEA